MPLLLMHGWTGTVREFYDFIPMLTAPSSADGIAFEVIAPSLPGMAWSDATNYVGLGPAAMSVIMRNLMLKLGHRVSNNTPTGRQISMPNVFSCVLCGMQRFLIQGGDYGGLIGSYIATLFPKNVIAYHSNFCGNLSPLQNLKGILANIKPKLFIPAQYKDFVFPQLKTLLFLIEETGYFHIQATKPDTVGKTESTANECHHIIELFHHSRYCIG